MANGPDAAGDYARAHAAGVEAGAILERLKQHDRHFERINGSMEKIAGELHKFNLGIERLTQQAAAESVTRVSTASALKAQEDERRARSAQSWSPLARLIAVLGVLTAMVGTALTLVLVLG